jgi:hypothetical protein
MLPWIIGAAVVGVGAYLLDDASSSNTRARREYDDVCDKAEKRVNNTAFKAKRKDALDKLFKMKKAKQKVADAIYEEFQQVNRELQRINLNLRDYKEILAELFEQKRATNSRTKNQMIQKKINGIQIARKEIFSLKDMLFVQQRELKARLKVANKETRMVQDEINRVLASN